MMATPCKGSLDRSTRALFAAGLALLVLFPATAAAQVWLVGGAATVDTECLADDLCPPLRPPTALDPPPTGLVPGLFGSDMGAASEAGCIRGFSQCHTSASGSVQFLVDGVEERCVRVRWAGVAGSQHACVFGAPYEADANANLTAALFLTPDGLPDGTPVTVFWRWRHVTTNNYDDPDGLPDHSHAELGTLSFNGADLFAGDYDMVDNRGWLTGSDSGTFDSTIGAVIPFGKSFDLWVEMLPPPEHPTAPIDDDGELVSYGGEFEACLDGPPPPLDPNGWIEFSIDMGSDTSLADVPPFEADEVFDPGDMYLLFDTTPIFPLGVDGLKDDLLIPPGFDPAPVAPGLPVPDSCSGAPAPFANLDVDGSDTLDVATADSLKASLWPFGFAAALPVPMPMAPTACIRRAEHLLISLDDDGPTNVYDAVCQAPSFDGSPVGETYGSLGFQDEVIEMDTLGGAPPVAVITYPVADEALSHVSMGPDPPHVIPTVPGDQGLDDDIDALDATRAECPTWLYTVDNEASLGAPPTDISRVTPAGPDPIVTGVHLGLMGTEIRDFEFVVTTDAAGADVLTLLFTVGPDDPTTFGDESTGLDAKMVYGSYLTGSHFPYLFMPLPDAVDAITALPVPLPPAPVDADGDGVSGDMDCAPGDGTVWSAPGGPIQDLNVGEVAGGIELSWSAPADPGGTTPLYDVFEANLVAAGDLPPAYACASGDTAATSVALSLPPLGTASLYVVRAQTACGEGPVEPTTGGNIPILPACP